MKLEQIKCPACGASINISDLTEFADCEYCGTQIRTGIILQNEKSLDTEEDLSPQERAIKRVEVDYLRARSELKRRETEFLEKRAEYKERQNKIQKEQLKVGIILHVIFWGIVGMIVLLS